MAHYSSSSSATSYPSDSDASAASNNGAPDLALALYKDPWKIKKELTTSDVDSSSRLLLSKDDVKKHVFSSMNKEDVQLCWTVEGKEFEVWDADTSSPHKLVLKKWASTSYFVLAGGWKKEFVNRRELKKDDLIGLAWYGAQFYFKLLNKN